MSTSASDPKPAVTVTGYPAPASVVGTPDDAAAAAAYPRPAPPSHAAPNYYYQPQHQFSNAVQPPPSSYYPSDSVAYSYAFLRRMFAFAAVLFLVILLATLIFWIVLRPRVPEVTLSSVSLSAFNISSSTLDADFNVAFTFHNPNSKMGVYYDDLMAAAFYVGENIASVSLPPFYQSKGMTTDLRARLVAAGAYVISGVGGEIKVDSSSGNGLVRFQFAVVAWVQFRSGAWWTRWHVMRVSCDDVLIDTHNATANSESNQMVPRKCLVTI